MFISGENEIPYDDVRQKFPRQIQRAAGASHTESHAGWPSSLSLEVLRADQKGTAKT